MLMQFIVQKGEDQTQPVDMKLEHCCHTYVSLYSEDFS